MNPMVKMKVQRAAGITVKGYIGMERGEPFVKVGVYFDNGRWFTMGSFRHIYREASRRTGRHEWKSSEYIEVVTETANGQVTFNCFLVPPTDSRNPDSKIEIKIDHNALSEINRLLRAVDHTMDLYDLQLVREQAIEENDGDPDRFEDDDEEVLDEDDIEVLDHQAADSEETSIGEQLIAMEQAG